MAAIELMGSAALVLSALTGRCHGTAAPVEVSLEWQAHSVPGALRHVAQEEVTAIWGRLDVRVRWIVGQTTPASATVVRAIVSDEFGHALPGGALPHLGRIEFYGARPANVIRVSAVAALDAAREARVQGQVSSGYPLTSIRIIAARLIGRALAHELGHYVLRSRQHTSNGLMRAVFPAYEALVPLLDRYRLDGRQLMMLAASCR